jgi:tellurite resistance protein
MVHSYWKGEAMGFFKCLAYMAGAALLAPVTGGASLAVAVGAAGAIGAASGNGKKAAYQRGVAEGTKAGELVAQKKYEAKIAALTKRLQDYQNFDKKLVALYAIGLAVANADGEICEEERDELNQFVAGCMAGQLPAKVVERIAKLTEKPPTLAQALGYAKRATLPKRDIDDVIDVMIHADGVVNTHEESFIARWKTMSPIYEASLA